MSTVDEQGGTPTSQDGSTRPMPKTHDDLTSEWLTAALRSGGLDVTVASFDRRPMGEGVGMMSALETIDLRYEEGDGPASAIVKLPAGNDANRAVAEAFDIYRREVLFYRDLAHRTPACTPKVFYADLEGSADFVLIMEDLSDYRLGDQLHGCSAEDAEMAMVELAKLHASFWDAVDGPEFDFIPYDTPSTHGDALLQGAEMGWAPTMATFGHVVSDDVKAAWERYLAAVPAMQRWLTTAPTTITHGDFRMDNLFFGQLPDHEELAAIDWQGCLRAKGVRDVAYLLAHNLAPDLRKEHERHLVEHWHATLESEGVTGYSAEQAWEDYRRAVLFVWTVCIVIAGTLDSANERGLAWMTEMVRRNAAALVDLDLFELLPEFE